MSRDRRVVVHPSKANLADSVASLFVSQLISLINEHGRANVVLTGGSLGSGVLESVNAMVDRDSVDWQSVDFWWGDDRWLPRGDAERNETQARVALLDHLNCDGSNIHAFPSSDDGLDLDAAAAAYAEQLRAAAPDGEQIPHFDITFLGMGPDGHIASLFPGAPGILVTDAAVIAVRQSPKPPAERLSLTLPTIKSSDRVWLVLSGADKAAALGLTLAGASMSEVPAAGAKGRHETVFFVDADAASEVPENLTTTEIFWTAADN
jgi:6-phosphogluconolactonase